MNKVLIIAYFYPPATVTASARPQSWVEELHKFGWYPIVITRHWDRPITYSEDVVQSSNKPLDVEKHKTHEVHRLPYKPGLSDKLRLAATRRKWVRPLRKLAAFTRLLRQLKSTRVIPSRNLYQHTARLMMEFLDINHVIVTGRPFEHFHFGYKLKKRFPHIKWIADYRDDWTSSELEDYSGFFGRIRWRAERRAERKWVRTAAHVTCVAPAMVPRIESITSNHASVIFNGYDDVIGNSESLRADKLTITYNGTLYDTQPVESFLGALQRVRSKHPRLTLSLEFPGLAYSSAQEQRVKTALGSLAGFATITDRIPHIRVLALMAKSDILVMLAHRGYTGIPSSKIFEYIALRKPVLLYPSDNDILEEILTSTGLGIICRNEDELCSTLEEIAQKKMRGEPITVTPNEEAVAQYSRIKQTEKLARILGALG